MTGHEAPGGPSDLYDQAPCGLLTITRGGEILAANETIVDWIGGGSDLDVRFHNLLRAGDRIYWETHIAPLLDMQGTVEEIAMEFRNGEIELPVLLNAAKRSRDSEYLIDVAVFKAVDRRSYERELLNARKLAEQSEKKAKGLAETLQRSLIPPVLPQIQRITVGATYKPAGAGDEVGGDFYDLFQLSQDEWMVVVGDVCGKGAEAAALTALVRYTIRGAAMETPRLNDLATDVNTALMLDRTDRTATVLMMKLDLTQPRELPVTVCSAGHPLPRLLHPDGTVTPVGGFGVLLGAFDEIRVQEVDLVLPPGASLVVFTDGVTDSRRDDEFFGDARLDAVIAESNRMSPHEIATALADAAMEFQDGTLRDDIAIVVLKNEQSPE